MLAEKVQEKIRMLTEKVHDRDEEIRILTEEVQKLKEQSPIKKLGTKAEPMTSTDEDGPGYCRVRVAPHATSVAIELVGVDDGNVFYTHTLTSTW